MAAPRLPPEIIEFVLSYLPPSELSACSAVCSLWRDIVSDATLWRPHIKDALDVIRWHGPPGRLHLAEATVFFVQTTHSHSQMRLCETLERMWTSAAVLTNYNSGCTECQAGLGVISHGIACQRHGCPTETHCCEECYVMRSCTACSNLVPALRPPHCHESCYVMRDPRPTIDASILKSAIAHAFAWPMVPRAMLG